MMKRVFSVLVAFALSLSLVCMPVSASSSDDVSDVKNACGQYFSLLDDYLRGNITYEAFKDKTTALLHDVPDKGKDTFTKLVNGLTNAAEGVSYGVSNGSAAFVKVFRDFCDGMTDFYTDYYNGVIDPIVDTFKGVWDKFCNDNGYVTSNIDLQGYGALFYYFQDNDKIAENGKYYCDYIELVSTDGVLSSVIFHCSNSGKFEHYFTGSVVTDKKISTSEISSFTVYPGETLFEMIINGSCLGRSCQMFGDIRYSDGTIADDYITENNNTPLSPDDIDPNMDLTDFLEALLDKLKNMFPDMSNIEGLLQSIYNRLGTLDKDDDSGLLSSILSALNRLEAGEEVKGDRQKIIKDLNSIVNDMITADDFKVDSTLYGQRFDLVKTAITNKFSFVSDIKEFLDYSFSCYTNSDTVPNIPIKLFGLTHYLDFSAFDDYIDLIRFVIASFVYIMYAVHTYRKIPSYINGGDNE